MPVSFRAKIDARPTSQRARSARRDGARLRADARSMPSTPRHVATVQILRVSVVTLSMIFRAAIAGRLAS
jgi:hypothetical protein